MQAVSSPTHSIVNAMQSVTTQPGASKKTKKAWSKLDFNTFQPMQTVQKPLLSEDLLDRMESALNSSKLEESLTPIVRPEAKKSINGNYKGVQYVCASNVRDKVLFSQLSISDYNKVGNTDVPLDELADSMFIEFRKGIKRHDDGALDIVQNPDGTYTSLDNRRLFISYKIGEYDRYYGIWVRVHHSNDPLEPGLQKRFLGAKNWGAAAAIRVKNSGEDNPNIYGFNEYPTIYDEGKKKSSKIALTIKGCDLSSLHPDDVEKLTKLPKNINGTVNI